MVEDTADDADLIVAQLQFLGHRGVVAHDLLSGLEEARSGRFDLVFLDLGLPDVTEPLQAVRTLAAQGIPVVVATNRNDAELAIAALDAGATQYVVKHRLDIDRLGETIAAAMDRLPGAPEHPIVGDVEQDVRDVVLVLAAVAPDTAWVVAVGRSEPVASAGLSADRVRELAAVGWKVLAAGTSGFVSPEAAHDGRRVLVLPVDDPPVGVIVGEGASDAGTLLTIVEAESRHLARAAGRERARLDATTQADAVLTASQVDVLTGLLNRRGFDRVLQIEEQRARRVGTDDAVIMVDLDGLKEVNDAHGHAAGDELIRRAAHALDAAMRASDQLFRIGGDEFVVLATDCVPPGADALVHRLERALEAAGVEASIGSASRGRSGTLTSALDDADAEMYRDKQRRKAARRR